MGQIRIKEIFLMEGSEMKFVAGKQGYHHGVFHVAEKDEIISTATSEEWATKICSALSSICGIELKDDDSESGVENTFSVERAPDSAASWVIRNQWRRKELVVDHLDEDKAQKIAVRLSSISDKGGE